MPNLLTKLLRQFAPLHKPPATRRRGEAGAFVFHRAGGRDLPEVRVKLDQPRARVEAPLAMPGLAGRADFVGWPCRRHLLRFP